MQQLTFKFVSSFLPFFILWTFFFLVKRQKKITSNKKCVRVGLWFFQSSATRNCAVRTGMLVSSTIRGFYFWICISSSCLLALYTHWILPTESQKWHRFAMWWLKSVYELRKNHTHTHKILAKLHICCAQSTHIQSLFVNCAFLSFFSLKQRRFSQFSGYLQTNAQLWMRIFTGKVVSARCDRVAFRPFSSIVL